MTAPNYLIRTLFAAAGAAKLTRWPVLQVRHGLVLPPTRNKCNFGSGQSLQMESARKQPLAHTEMTRPSDGHGKF
jgi:hypothetical protein